MSTVDFVSQLDTDLAWRTEELNALKGVISAIEATLQDTLRKSAVLVLYSHLEGFCVFALRHFVEAVNQCSLTCGDVVPAILAGAWETLFNAVLYGDQKCEIFSRPLPNDKGLHSHWRRRHFVEEIRKFEAGQLIINDKVIDAESNLKPIVLQRNLFILGLDHTFVDSHAATLHRFLAKRNSIAHGTERRGIANLEYEEYERLSRKICRDLIDFLTDAHRNQQFRKSLPPTIPCG